MRPLLAIIIALGILASVAAYEWFVRTLPPIEVVDLSLEQAKGDFVVDVTLTFHAVKSDFALDDTTLLIKFEGKDIFRAEETIHAGTPLKIDVPDIKVGKNEFFLEVNTPAIESAPSEDNGFSLGTEDAPGPARILSYAARIRVLRDDEEVADETIWSLPGQSIRQRVIVKIPDDSHEGHDHPHH